MKRSKVQSSELQGGLQRAREKLLTALERASAQYKLTYSVDDLLRCLEPFIERIVRMGGARMPLPTAEIDPSLTDLFPEAIADATKAVNAILPAGKRRNRQAKAWAVYAHSDRHAPRGAQPTVRSAAVQIGVLAIEAATRRPFAMSRSHWPATKRRGARIGKPGGSMLHLLQAILLMADTRKWLHSGNDQEPATISLETLARKVNVLRRLKNDSIPADYSAVVFGPLEQRDQPVAAVKRLDLSKPELVERLADELEHLVRETEERHRKRRNKPKADKRI